jgi:hypothetical protein
VSHLTHSVNVDIKGVEKVRDLTSQRKTRVILLPMFKSYGDPLILHYVNYFMNLELGFSFGNYEDSPKISFVESIFKRIGLFLIKRKD